MDLAASHSSDWSDVSTDRMPLDSDFTTMQSSSTSGWVVDKSSFNPKKIIRFSSLKRGKEEVPISERVKLERVLGLTVNSNASLDSDPVTGAVVYPAGCVIVVYHPRKNKQTHILNASKKTITSLAVSADGKYVVTGECGHQPHVRVWDVLERTQVVEFPGHKFGINCVAFSPNLKYVVSIGTQHDMIVNVWDWRSNVKVASNKVSSKVKAIAFSEDGGYFVTVGNRHVKFWYLEYFRSSKYKEPVPLMGRSAILGEQRNNYFCDVACGKADVADSTYSITKSGLLCEFNNRRLLDKWVELRTTSANCLCVGIDYIFIGCADGIVRCFSPYTLDFITTLPRTHYLGVDISKGLSIAHMGSHPSSAKYPDTVAITLDETNLKVTCVYNDHSLYVWDIHDIRKVGKSHSFLYHSACIWGVETYPSGLDNGLLPPNTFVTCSSDDTVRIWNLDPNMSNETAFKRNVYTSDLLKILYVDEELSYLCEATHSPSGTGEKGDTTYDSRNGVRCIKISPDGRHLASGDRSGNIRIHDIQYMDELCKIEAHDAEVLCLEYSKLENGHRYLASASRDRLIHVFDVNKEYQFLQTLDDHSSSITAVRFVQRNGQLQMISCGADKSVIFRGAHFKPQLHFSRDNHVVGKTTLYDMEVDVNHKHILTACQDRNIRVYNIGNGKHSRTFKGSQGEDGTLIKVVLDNSGMYLATSCTDKNLYVYDFSTGECVATMFGHSEIVTGFRFSNDGKHLISVSGDGCIFYWKLPTEITHSMQVKLADMRSYAAAKQEVTRHNFSVPRPVKPFQDSNVANLNMFENAEMAEDGSYRFSVGPLPLWAKKQITDMPSAPDSEHIPNTAQPQPRGRWAQRIDGQGILVKSIYDTGHVIPYPPQSEVDNLPPELDGYTEAFHKYMDVRRETIIISKQGGQTHEEFEPSSQSLNEIRMRRAASAEIPSGTITTRRGDSSMSARIRHPTDSTVSSSAQDDYEYDQDGDVADDETDSTEADVNEQEVIYYPPFEHDTSFPEGEFKVCNTNPDDLREAHRRNRKVKAERPTDIPLLQVHGVRSTDSEDEDEATTPHSTDRNILSMFSISTESLDRVGQREKFLQKNFESLDGDKSGEDTENNDNRTSISARFLSTSSSNTPSGKAKKGQELPSPKKLQLLKQMEETRKKLDTIGWKASLNSSKSISDLTHIPEKDFADKSHFHNKDKSETIRRASSMSDLSKPIRRLLPSPPSNVTRRPPVRPDSSGNSLRRSSVQHDSNTSSSRIARSSSMSTLAGAGEEDSRLMRPTISSLNKARGSQSDLSGRQQLPKSASSSSLVSARRDLTYAGSGTSSGETSPTETKPELPPRTRSASVDRNSKRPSRPEPRVSVSARSNTSMRTTLSTSHSASERDVSKLGHLVNDHTGSSTASTSNGANVTVTKTSKHELFLKRGITTSARRVVTVSATSLNSSGTSSPNQMLEKSPQELPVKDTKPDLPDVFTAPLDQYLCEVTAESLKLSADNVMQLCKRISMDSDLSEAERLQMLNTLSQAATQAQQTLRPIHLCTSTAQDPVNPRKAPEVPNNGDPMSNLLQQYSDMLLSLVQQRITSQPTLPFPPNQKE